MVIIIIKYIVNPIDQALILSIYEFIGGEKLHELRSLTLKDVDVENKKVKLIDVNGNFRIQNISTKLAELLQEAGEQKEYLLGNGLSNKRETQMLAESDYIFRMLRRKDNRGKMADYGGLINKLNTIKKYTGYNLITVNSIKETRIIHEITDVAQEMGRNVVREELYKIAFDNIYKQYGVKFTESQLYNLKIKYEQAIQLKNFND